MNRFLADGRDDRTARWLVLLLALAVILWLPAVAKADDIADLKKRAEHGDAPAQYELGDAYFNGKGVAQDDKEAAKWYCKSAEQGYVLGQNDCGWMH